MLPPRQNTSLIYVERPRIYLHLCPSPVVLAAVRDQGYCPGCPEPTTILLPWASNKAITELVSALTSLVLTSNMQGTTITRYNVKNVNHCFSSGKLFQSSIFYLIFVKIL